MLDQLFENPVLAISFMVFVVYLLVIYLTNKERAKVKQMRGTRRFQPDWGRRTSTRRQRRDRLRQRHGRQGFQPEWRREAKEDPSGESKTESEKDPSQPDPMGETDPDR